jgi:hypothetical protein
MLRIDADGSESGQDAARTTANSCGNQAFQPQFDALHSAILRLTCLMSIDVTCSLASSVRWRPLANYSRDCGAISMRCASLEYLVLQSRASSFFEAPLTRDENFDSSDIDKRLLVEGWGCVV